MTQVNESVLNELLGRMVNDLGACVNGSLVLIGDKLGLYAALKEAGEATSTELTQQTGTSERYVREWLAAQATSGYIMYDPDSKCFSLSPEQAMVFADKDNPVLMTGGFFSVSSVYADEPNITEAFKSGDGVSWGDHDSCLFCGTARFLRPTYLHNIVQSWIPALNRVEEELKKGIKVADVGSGFAISTMLMAQAYPKSEFLGIDLHEHSIEHAKQEANELGLTNIEFVVANVAQYESHGFDFVTYYDCLHDMGDPAGEANQIKDMMDNSDTWMIVEPFANDNLVDNFTPLGEHTMVSQQPFVFLLL